MKFDKAILAAFLLISLITAVLSPDAWADQYRTNGTGNWNVSSTWQRSTDGGTTWSATSTRPGNASTDTALIRNGLTLTNGTFKLSSASTITPFGGTITIGSTAGYFLNNAGATSNWGGSGSLIVNGDLKITNGIMTIGTGANRLEIGSTGVFEQSGGSLNVRGRLQATTAGGSLTLSGGTFAIPAGGTVSTATNSMFEVSASAFSMTGGTVSIASPNGNTTLPDVNINLSGTPITGGTFFITSGSTGTAKSVSVNSNVPFHDFTVTQGTDALTARLRTNALRVSRNLTITSGALDAATNAINMQIGGNWSNSGTFLPGTNTVEMNGASPQTMNGSTFNNLRINNSTGITLLSNETVNGTFTLTTGNVTTNANNMIIC